MTSTLLSNIVVGRNDDYGGGYLSRLATSLNYLAENLSREGRQDDMEVVYVDWGSEAPIADAVELTPEAAALVRFVEVDSKVVTELSESRNFYATLAVNVGVRRARGMYIMLADSDGLMRRNALSSLLKLLDGQLDPDFNPAQYILPIRRIQIPFDIVRRNPSLRRWDEILDALQPGARTESPGTGCLGGFSAGQLMHRNLWYEFEGYNEALKRSWGWSDNELMLRVTQKYDWADLVAYGVMAFHMEHGPRRRWWNATELPQRESQKVNTMLVGSSLSPNGPNWGLADREFPIRKAAGSKTLIDSSSLRGDVGPLTHGLVDGASLRAASSTSYVQGSVDRVLSHCARAYGVEPDDAEKACLATLVAYVSTASPLNFHYYGDLLVSLLFGVLTEHTAIETYLFRPWLDGDSSQQPCHPGLLSQVLEHSMYRGYARIVGGDPIEAHTALPLSDGIELALVHTSRRQQQTDRMLQGVVARLARGGVVVIYGPQQSKELERYDRVASKEVRAAAECGRPFDPARRPFSQSLSQFDLVRVVTLTPDRLTFIVRLPAANS